MFQTVSLNGVVIPESSDLRRRHVRKEHRWSEHYLERYDNRTFLYDCFYQPEKGCYVVTAPRFLNLWHIVKKHLWVNGERNRYRIKKYTWQRCQQFELYAPANSTLRVDAPGLVADIPVRETLQECFSGKNVALAMNKNNRLEWIIDWVRYHVEAHGLQGVCIIDNGSDLYTVNDILASLKKIAGLQSAVVIHAPFPYGPVNASLKLEISPRFLQTSMFNLVKRDMFNKARAILSVDIDELVVANTGVSVFDAAVASKLGNVSFRELKVFPKADQEKAYPHAAHCYIKKNAKPGSTKWCVSGKGFMNQFGWAVHRYGGAFFLFTETDSFSYLHCQATSTSWKSYRYDIQEDIEESPRVKAVMSKYLSE